MNTDDSWVSSVLEQAVGPEPELGFRAEDVLRRAHRDLARRRVALTGLVTVLALIATGLLLSNLGSPHSAGPASGGIPATSTPTLTTGPAVKDSTVWGAEGPLVIDAHSRELTAVLASQHILPAGVTASEDKDYGGQPLVFYKITVGTQYLNDYYAEAKVTDSHGTGQFFVRVEQHPDGITCAADNQGCYTQDLSDGSHLTVLRYTPPSPGAKQDIQWMVELVRPDGTAVQAACGNWGTGGIGNTTGVDPPIGKDTLIQLVELPALRF